ncbi:MAG: CHAT domain-containing protein [Pseudanabaenales cyanobacterium]|nr:CHAT domain-containing protein [Pseudanabaenales cyanobacterium]
MTQKILILAANPKNTSQLRLDEEVREIDEGLRQAKHRDQFQLIQKWATRPRDIYRALLEETPTIVHFSGHGAGEDGLIFEDEVGQSKWVTGEALARLFKLFADQVECVVLNGCYSQLQAEAIALHIPYVIGMQQAIGDRAAITFAVGFYDALGAGRSLEFAYQLGCSAIQMEGIPEQLTPTLNNNRQLTQHPITVSKVQTSPTLPPPFPRPEAVPQRDYRDRQALLSKVRNFWLKGVLETSLHGRAKLELGLEHRVDKIEHPWGLVWESPNQTRSALPPETKVIDLFDELGTGATLLILGAPGSGKTTTLLQLTSCLIVRAEQAPSNPLPLVLNLSAWEGGALAPWIIEELNNKYQLPKQLGKRWVEQQELTLMLDGLDEVAEYRRERCVKVINQFSQTHGRMAIVVCSRLKDYDVLTTRLRFQGAVLIQPLTDEQVEAYLGQAGESLQGVREMLVQDKRLQELTQSPLMLSIMTIAYQGLSVSELQQLTHTENRTQPLIQLYINQMLNRQRRHPPYTRFQTEKWLQCLALKMLLNAQSIFSLEQMQPQRFLRPFQLCIYRLSVGLLLGVIYGTLFGFIYRSVIVLWTVYFNAYVVPFAGDDWMHFPGETTWHFSFFPIVFHHMMALDFGPMVGRIIGICSVLPSALLGQFDLIKPIESLQFSWQRARLIVSLGIILSVLAGQFTGGAGCGAIVSLMISLLFSFGWVSANIQSKTFPNEGIWRSASIASTLLFLVDISIFLGLVQFMNPFLFEYFMHGLGLGFSVGLLVILRSKPVSAGIALLQHIVLRTVLWGSGFTPRNYVRFLNYATRCALMQQVGGGYIFLHRFFLEYFALKD